MVRPTLEAPFASGVGESENWGAALGYGRVLGSNGGSASRPALLSGSVPALGSGTRYDAHVKPGVDKECGPLLPMWCDAVRPLSIDADAYDYVLLIGTLSINTTACEYMELVVVLGFALMRKCGGDVAYSVSAVGSPFFTSHIDVARVRH